MGMTSNLFIIFLLVCMAVYYLIPGRFQWIVLLSASFAYYLAESIPAAFFLIYTICVSYGCARVTEKIIQGSKSRKEGKKKARKVLILCMVLDFGMLGFLKYTNFILESLGHLFRTDMPLLHLLLPLGISYYTFQSVGYMLDVYWGRSEPEKNIFRYALFLSWFPQLVQGPIGRAGRLMPQLCSEHHFDGVRTKRALERIVWGLAKKMILADWAAVYRTAIFNDPDRFSGIAVFGLLMYTVELYGNFSGGIDVMLGVSELFGVTLDENFRQPFLAVSISDFWQRWHITLGTWMKDYVMYPLTLSSFMNKLGKRSRKIFGKKKGRLIPVCISNLIVFFLVGIWHGASWNNIGWGLYNGVIIAFSSLFAEEYTKTKRMLHINDQSMPYHIFTVLRTFVLINISWYFDCADSFGTAMKMMKYSVTQFAPSQLLTISSGKLGTAYTPTALAILGVGCVIMFVIGLIKEKGVNIPEKFSELPLPAEFAVFLLLFICIPVCAPMGEARGFLYAQF